MKIVKYVAAGLLILFFGVWIGMSGDGAESEKPQANITKTDSPEPTPTLTPTPTRMPTPEPTPQVIVETVEVEVVPPVCREALWAADVVMGDSATLVLDILDAYTAFPDENLGEFGQRVEDIIMEYDASSTTENWDEYVELADECHDV